MLNDLFLGLDTMFNFIHSSINNFFSLAITPCLPEYEYAVYIYLSGSDNTLHKIDQIWYQNESRFEYFYDLKANEYLVFKFFIRHKENKTVLTINSDKISSDTFIMNLNQVKFYKNCEVKILNNWTIPIKYQRFNERKKHIVLFNGALSKKTNYYTYHRVTWINKFKANMLNIYDSTLSLRQDFTLGWYQGKLNDRLMPYIFEIIEKLKKDNNLNNSDLIFYGSSGGGWTALKFAEYFKGSVAVAINPQINILDYHSSKARKMILEHSFNKNSEEYVRKNFSNDIEIDAKKFIPSNEDSRDNFSRFILVQNIQDPHHFNSHFSPFWAKFSDSVTSGWDKFNHNYAIVYDHVSGHAAEPDEIFDLIMNKLNSEF